MLHKGKDQIEGWQAELEDRRPETIAFCIINPPQNRIFSIFEGQVGIGDRKKGENGRKEKMPWGLVVRRLFFILFIGGCAEVRLQTIPAPPPSAKLRSPCPALTGSAPPGGWKGSMRNLRGASWGRFKISCGGRESTNCHEGGISHRSWTEGVYQL